MVGKLDQLAALSAGEPQHCHGPAHDAAGHIVEAADAEGLLDFSGFHGEYVASALKMVVGENRAAHDGQVGIGAHKVVRKLGHKVQELAEAGAVDLHGRVLGVKDDAVLVVINVGRVLEVPAAFVDGKRDNPMVLPRRVVEPSGIALVFGAQLDSPKQPQRRQRRWPWGLFPAWTD